VRYRICMTAKVATKSTQHAISKGSQRHRKPGKAQARIIFFHKTLQKITSYQYYLLYYTSRSVSGAPQQSKWCTLLSDILSSLSLWRVNLALIVTFFKFGNVSLSTLFHYFGLVWTHVRRATVNIYPSIPLNMG
jgi:hypothetical protein